MSLFHCPEITNIKFHFKLNEDDSQSLNSVFRLYRQIKSEEKGANLDEHWNVKQASNFHVLRPKSCLKSKNLINNKLVFICFESGHVNVTGVRKKDFIQESVEIFTDYFGLDHTSAVLSHQIDNLCAKSSSCKQEVNLMLEKHLGNFLNYVNTLENEQYSASYNPLLFSGLFLKIHEWDTVCTINLFQSGRCCYVGLKNSQQLERATLLLSEIVSRWMLHLKEEKSVV